MARLVRWSTLLGLVVGVVWSTSVYAQSGERISTEFLLSAVLTIGLALAHGFSRGVDRRVIAVEGRVTAVEHDYRQQQTQISLLRETLPSNYHTKAEHAAMDAERARQTAEHRERVERQLSDINHRLDAMVRPHHRREDDR